EVTGVERVGYEDEAVDLTCPIPSDELLEVFGEGHPEARLERLPLLRRPGRGRFSGGWHDSREPGQVRLDDSRPPVRLRGLVGDGDDLLVAIDRDVGLDDKRNGSAAVTILRRDAEFDSLPAFDDGIVNPVHDRVELRHDRDTMNRHQVPGVE